VSRFRGVAEHVVGPHGRDPGFGRPGPTVESWTAVSRSSTRGREGPELVTANGGWRADPSRTLSPRHRAGKNAGDGNNSKPSGYGGPAKMDPAGHRAKKKTVLALFPSGQGGPPDHRRQPGRGQVIPGSRRKIDGGGGTLAPPALRGP